MTAEEKSNVSTVGVGVDYELPNWEDQGEGFGEQWMESSQGT